MTREEAVRRIERATEEKLIELDLRGLELEELPPEIAKCMQLETLLLGDVCINNRPLAKKYVLYLKVFSSLGQTLNYWVDWHLLKVAQPARQ